MEVRYLHKHLEDARASFGDSLKVGDKVMIRTQKAMTQEFRDLYSVPCSFMNEMTQYCGKVVTIVEKSWSATKSMWVFRIASDRNHFAFSIYMFECAQIKTFIPQQNYNIGDQIGDFTVLQLITSGVSYYYSEINQDTILINGFYYPKSMVEGGTCHEIA